MNHEWEVKLQAYLDGELDARQAGEVEAHLRVARLRRPCWPSCR